MLCFWRTNSLCHCHYHHFTTFLHRPRHHLTSSSDLTPPWVGLGVVAMSIEAGLGVIRTKLGMMSYFEADGKVVPVTIVRFREGNILTQINTESVDGYDVVQVGYKRVRDKKFTKPKLGHLEKAGVIPMRHLQEFRLQDISGFEVGKTLVLEVIFKEGDLVDVSGTTIGK